MTFNHEERTEENVKRDRLQTPIVAPAQSAPAWMFPTPPNIDRAIETLSSILGRVPEEIEVAEALNIGLEDYREARRGREDLDSDDFYSYLDAQEEKRRWQRK